jgi:predicted nucleic acid-binding protein
VATAERLYVDPSALRCLYVHEARSRAFCAWRNRHDRPLPITLFGRAALGTRALDVLHVASALTLGCKRFVTYDARQARLGRAVGLRVSGP